MKKLTSLILASLLIMSLSACGVATSPEPEATPEPSLESGILNIDNQLDDIDEKDDENKEEKALDEDYSSENPSANDEPLVQETKPEDKSSQTPIAKAEDETPATETPKPNEVAKEDTPEEKAKETKPKEEQTVAKPSPKPDEDASTAKDNEPKEEADTPTYIPSTSGETKAVWISYLDLNSILKGKSQSAYTSSLSASIKNMKESGFNTVIFQVRPFSDALYPSQYFPWSAYASGVEGKSPGFDPLQIAVDLTHNAGMKFEAWVNPYRIKSSGSVSSLSEGHIAKELYNNESDAVIAYNGGVYYNPASSEAQELIVDGVKEIVANYDVDAIHFDDYFYPTTDASFDSSSYNQYKNSGGKLGLADWRRQNVNELVSSVYSGIKSVDSSTAFGISPQGNMSNNYNSMYIDVEHWVKNKGYIDYIMPQIYFGFENSGQPFAKTVKNWHSLCANTSVDLYIGLAPYKIGVADTWAGNGKNEWINNDDILQRMVLESRKYSSYAGFALFRYDSVYHPSSAVAKQVKTEIDNLADIM